MDYITKKRRRFNTEEEVKEMYKRGAYKKRRRETEVDDIWYNGEESCFVINTIKFINLIFLLLLLTNYFFLFCFDLYYYYYC